ncbi:BNR repeat-containing protein [Marinoscillum pacificum]|uniref:BNR repeat-containing protein n=1 Tax=Marinoscillum pacificum TaxID=392723 RepID=UPI002157FE50|nr:BNR repeat-containing protein [Marinoscillum pacificum]
MRLISQTCISLLVLWCNSLFAQTALKPLKSYVGEGWAKNSINTVIFRKNSLTSNDSVQFIAYYDPDGFLVLGKRKHASKEWEINTTQYKGNVRDAHNSASIELDQDGYLHVSWDHHNNALRYARGTTPGSLELGSKISMVGKQENVVSYPEFYKSPEGDLYFFYRDGGSGNGNMVINKYKPDTQTWERVQTNLIDGEGQRNAYWQATIDNMGAIHISWVWRESPDVASNNDLCYAKSVDGGKTWMNSKNGIYNLPITKSSAEVIQQIPQKSELINQTSMTTDQEGNPFIVSYWKPQGSAIPQFQIVYVSKNKWHHENLDFRKTPFSLSGMGTKQIPISRPQIVVSEKDVLVIFRDAERDNKVSLALNQLPFNKDWSITDYSTAGYDAWEPTLDPWLWKNQQVISLFIQKTTQVDGEGLSDKKSAEVEVFDLRFEY